MIDFQKEYELFVASDIKFSDKYKIQYIDLVSFNIGKKMLLKHSENESIDSKLFELLNKMFAYLNDNFIKYNFKVINDPRKRAQSYVGNKHIREFIFNRDKVCLKCGNSENLSIDHIKSVFSGGENIIDNLQTLCMNCNNKKGTNLIDYRK